MAEECYKRGIRLFVLSALTALCKADEFLVYGERQSSVIVPGFSDLETSGHLNWQFSSRKTSAAILDYVIGSAEANISPMYKNRVQFFPSNASVLIKVLQYSDEGNYTLTVQGAVTKTRTILLQVLGPLSDPLIFSYERNSSVELRCSTVSGSLLTFSWERGGSTLHNDTKYHLMEDYSTLTFTLTIRNLQKSDCGSYKCRVSNPVSVKESSYDLSSGDVCRQEVYLQWLVPVCALVPCGLFLIGSGIFYFIKKNMRERHEMSEETDHINP
ncbi:HEPACAM family member 2-like [Huso huso]|uniref:HEPACAM family member 2-like n=1 Tax=Huso huso TaxID=61971 RepID=A0ABR0Y571_HUSHU